MSRVCENMRAASEADVSGGICLGRDETVQDAEHTQCILPQIGADRAPGDLSCLLTNAIGEGIDVRWRSDRFVWDVQNARGVIIRAVLSELLDEVVRRVVHEAGLP